MARKSKNTRIDDKEDNYPDEERHPERDLAQLAGTVEYTNCISAEG